ncbi:MAG: PilZ domain-containing protein [Myxococcota bacterium]
MPRVSALARSTREAVEVADRRNLPRMQLDAPVTCEVGAETMVGTARSMSGEGLLIEADWAVTVGSTMHVRIGPPLTPSRPFEARMVVARVESAPGATGERYRIAGRFSRVFPSD